MASNSEELRKAQQRQARNENSLGRKLYDRLQVQQMERRKRGLRGSDIKTVASDYADAVQAGKATLAGDEQIQPGPTTTPSMIERPREALRRSMQPPTTTDPSGIKRTMVDGVPTFSGTGKPAAGEAAPKSFVDRLAAFREQNFATPPREIADRGFQYQPSQWAQQTALRNAMVGNERIVRDRRGRKVGTAFDQQRFEANVAADPRLQGLARSKMFQDNVTTDLEAAQKQRGQDMTYQLGVNKLKSDERTSAADQATELAKSRYTAMKDQYQYETDRGDKIKQQNFENTNTLLDQRASRFEDPQEQAAQRQRDINYITNSGIEEADVATKQRVLSLMDQFGEAGAYDQSVRDSTFPTLARFIGGILRKDEQLPQSSAQLEAMLKRADVRNLKEYGLDDNQIAVIQSLVKGR